MVGQTVELSRAATRRSRILTAARVGFLLVIGAAVVLGYLGMREYVRRPGSGGGRDELDIAYYVLQLFVLGSAPLEDGGPIPWSLQVARFLAPAATVYALFEAARTLFIERWRRWHRRGLAGHVIVTGTTPIADAVVADLRRRGRTVIHVADGGAVELAAAGIQGAAAVYACADDRDDPATNVDTAATAVQAGRRGRAPIRVYAMVSDSTFALAVRARRLGLAAGGAQVDFFNVDELAARELVRRDAGLFRAGTPARVVVAGLGAFGQALVVELARAWSLTERRDERLRIAVVDPDAERVAPRLAARWRAVAHRCVVEPVGTPLDEVAWGRLGEPPPHRVYLCQDDEYAAMRAALTVTDMWGVDAGALVLRLNRLGSVADAFTGARPALLDDLTGVLRVVSLPRLLYEGTAVTDLIHEDLIELLAQAIHRRYLNAQLDLGVTLGSTPAMRPWAELPEDLKNANRAQARDIPSKVAAIGGTIGPRGGRSMAVDGTLVDALAEREHDRWLAERQDQGWRYGEHRDNDRRLHPSIVPWDELSAAEKDKDRSVVEGIPEILAEAGLQIVRTGRPSPAATAASAPAATAASPPAASAPVEDGGSMVAAPRRLLDHDP